MTLLSADLTPHECLVSGLRAVTSVWRLHDAALARWGGELIAELMLGRARPDLLDQVAGGFPRCVREGADVLDQVAQFLSSPVESEAARSELCAALKAAHVNSCLLRDYAAAVRRAVLRPVDTEFWSQLRAGTFTLDERGAPVETLRAATVSRTFASDAERATQLRAMHVDVAREVGVRLARVDVVVLGSSDGAEADSGLLVGADVFTAESEGLNCTVRAVSAGLVSGAWRPATVQFEDGVRDGVRSARQLLLTLGCSEQDLRRTARVDIALRTVLPPTKLDDRSAGLPIALRVLAEASGLPRTDVGSTGAVRDGKLEPVPSDTAERKALTIASDGTLAGLIVYSPTARNALIRCPAAPTLAAAARAAWGPRWDDFVDARLAAVVAAATGEQLRVGWLSSPLASAALVRDRPLVATQPEAVELADYLDSPLRRTAFLGGSARSGKTWIAHGVLRRLRDQGRFAFALSPNHGAVAEVPEWEKAIAEVRPRIRALTSDRPILILDDFCPTDASVRATIQDVIGELAAECDASILTVLRSEPWSGWAPQEGPLTLPSIGKVRMSSFVRALADAAGIHEPDVTLLRRIEAASHRDVGVAAELVATVAAADVPTTDIVSAFSTQVRRRYTQWARNRKEREIGDAKRVAAASLVGLPVATRGAGSVTPSSIASLDGISLAGSTALIASRVRATLLLEATAGRGRTAEDAAVGALLGLIRDLVEAREFEAASRVLDRVALDDPYLLQRVADMLVRDRRCVTAYLQRAELSGSARFVDVLAPELGDEPLARLLRDFADKAAVEIGATSVRGAARVLLVLGRHGRGLREAADENGGAWERIIDAADRATQLWRGLGSATYADRLLLVRAVTRAGEERLDGRLRDHVDSLVTRWGDERRALSSRNLWRLLEILEGLERLGVEPVRWVDHAGLRSIVDAVLADADAAAGAVIAAFLLGNLVGARTTQAESEAEQVMLARTCRAIPKSGTLDVARALGKASRFHRGMTNRLVHDRSTSAALARALLNGTPGETAVLLGTLMNIAPTAVRHALYDRNGRPKRDVVALLGARVRECHCDAKGFGLLIRAVASLDEDFGTGRAGLADSLVGVFGYDTVDGWLRDDARHTVVSYALEAMARANVTMPPQFMERAADLVVASIERRNFLRGMTLYLALAAHADQGGAFTVMVAGRVKAIDISDSIVEASDPEVLRALFQLAEAVPGTMDRVSAFARDDERWEEHWDRLARAHWSETLVGMVRAWGNALQRAGMSDWRARMARVLGRSWTAHIRNTHAPGELAPVVRGLAGIDRGLTEHAVRSAFDRLRNGMLRIGWNPRTAAEILAATHSVAPDVAALLVSARAVSHRRLLEYDNPRTVAEAVERLLRSRDVPHARDARKLVQHWTRGVARDVTSPWTAAALLRATAALDAALNVHGDWVNELRVNVRWERFAERALGGMRADVLGATVLAGVVQAIGEDKQALRLIDVARESARVRYADDLAVQARVTAVTSGFDAARWRGAASRAVAAVARNLAASRLLSEREVVAISVIASHAALSNCRLTAEASEPDIAHSCVGDAVRFITIFAWWGVHEGEPWPQWHQRGLERSASSVATIEDALLPADLGRVLAALAYVEFPFGEARLDRVLKGCGPDVLWLLASVAVESPEHALGSLLRAREKLIRARLDEWWLRAHPERNATVAAVERLFGST